MTIALLLPLLLLADGRPSPPDLRAVRLADPVLAPTLDTVLQRTIPAVLERCERTGRVDNFRKAAGRLSGPHVGYAFDDSDVYKAVEAAAWGLLLRPDAPWRPAARRIVDAILEAQEDDGYLYTARTIDPASPPEMAGPERWSNLAFSHELYCAGHFYEAAVAWKRATGDGRPLDAALLNARLLLATFGEGKRVDVPGHEEIEIGLLRLFEETGDRRLADLALFFLDARGREDRPRLYGEYAQDHAPVAAQNEAVGHAVRAMYLFRAAAMADRMLGREDLGRAARAVFRDVVERKAYVTGGVGARRNGESFGAPFELPNENAYAETCAAIALAWLAQEIALDDADARAADVLEWSTLNAVRAGLSLDGTRFFYPNPLAFDGVTPFNHGSCGRADWFACACCPPNLARFFVQAGRLPIAVDGTTVWVLAPLALEAELPLPDGGTADLSIQGDYPFGGEVTIELTPPEDRTLELRVRVPGWAIGRPLRSDLYRARDRLDPPVARAGDRTIPAPPEGGFWSFAASGDAPAKVQLDLPVRPVRLEAHPAVRADSGRVALALGPLLYCVEGFDHGGDVRDLWLPPDAALRAVPDPEGPLGAPRIEAEARRVVPTEDGSTKSEPVRLVARPYFAWGARGASPMAVWIPERPDLARPRPPPTAASRARVRVSHCYSGDTPEAVHDLREPTSSADTRIPRHTFWPHKGGVEWIELAFDEPVRVRGVEIYWFDDERTGGGCRTPETWRVLADAGDGLAPVAPFAPPRCAPDRWDRVEFAPLTARRLRVEVRLREGFSAGVLEMRVLEAP